jgi:cytochrome c-type biogenesis protein CcmH/NrfG
MFQIGRFLLNINEPVTAGFVLIAAISIARSQQEPNISRPNASAAKIAMALDEPSNIGEHFDTAGSSFMVAMRQVVVLSGVLLSMLIGSCQLEPNSKSPSAETTQPTATPAAPRTKVDSLPQQGVQTAKQNDYASKIAQFSQAIRQNPNDIDAYYERGTAYFGLCNFKAAIADYNQVIQRKPAHYEAYLKRGMARRAAGDLEGGASDFRQAGKLFQNQVDTELQPPMGAEKMQGASQFERPQLENSDEN